MLVGYFTEKKSRRTVFVCQPKKKETKKYQKTIKKKIQPWTIWLLNNKDRGLRKELRQSKRDVYAVGRQYLKRLVGRTHVNPSEKSLMDPEEEKENDFENVRFIYHAV